jgi:hypothetical protein
MVLICQSIAKDEYLEQTTEDLTMITAKNVYKLMYLKFVSRKLGRHVETSVLQSSGDNFLFHLLCLLFSPLSS